MAMADNGRVVCKCTARRSFCFREVTFDEKPNLRNHLRNVSTVPLFRNGLITRCPSVAGNSILRFAHTIIVYFFVEFIDSSVAWFVWFTRKLGKKRKKKKINFLDLRGKLNTWLGSVWLLIKFKMKKCKRENLYN